MNERRWAKLGKRLAAYSLAAGATSVGVQGVSAGGLVYDNGGAGWFDDRPHMGGGDYGTWDMILFKLDGTVLVDDAQIDPTLPNAPSIEFLSEHYAWQFIWGDGFTRDSMFVRLSGAGVVGHYWADCAEVGRLASGVTVDSDSAFVTGNSFSDFAGMFGYGYYGNVGTFSLAPRGYIGFYIEDGDGDPHYGWADVELGSTQPGPFASMDQLTLHGFAISDVKDLGVITGGGEVPEPLTISLLAAGAAGLLARRRK